jgi:hypothetical protein
MSRKSVGILLFQDIKLDFCGPSSLLFDERGEMAQSCSGILPALTCRWLSSVISRSDRAGNGKPMEYFFGKPGAWIVGNRSESRASSGCSLSSSTCNGGNDGNFIFL